MKLIKYIFFLIPFSVFATNYYVATDGSGDYTTITQVNAGTYSAGDSILFKRGDTFTGELNINQHGAYGNHIVIGAYGSGELPIVNALTELSGWSNEGDGVYSCPFTSSLDINLLIINDTLQHVGRYPNSGYLSYSESDNSTPTGYIKSTSLDASTTDWTNAEVVIKRNNWTIGRHDISSASNDTIWFDYDSFESIRTGSSYGFFIQRDIRTLDEYGEWFHDKDNNKMYVYFGGENPSTKTIQSTLYDYGSESLYRGYLTIEYIKFTGQNNKAIYADWSTSFQVKNCIITQQGGQGIFIQGGYDDIIVSDNIISECNGEGIRIGESGSSDGVSVTNNSLSNCAYMAGMGLSAGRYDGLYARGSDVEINYNTVSGCGYNGASGLPVASNTIVTMKYNYLTNTNQLLADGASLYIWYEVDTVADMQESEIAYNIITNSPSIGIYSDGYVNHLYVHDNTTVNIKRGLHSNEPRYNYYTNNTFYNCTGYGMRLQNAQQTGDLVEARENLISKNIIVNSELSTYSIRDGNNQNIWNLGVIDSNYIFMEVGDTIADGYTIPYTEFGYNLSEWQSEGFDNNSTFYDLSPEIRYNPTMTTITAFADSSGTLVDGTIFTNGVTLDAFGNVVAYNVTANTQSTSVNKVLGWKGIVLGWKGTIIGF